jgi:exonuclease III
MTKSDTFLMLGFIDILWLFGVENSKEYTWWYVLHILAGGQ